jgi:hypothetical protein
MGMMSSMPSASLAASDMRLRPRRIERQFQLHIVTPGTARALRSTSAGSVPATGQLGAVSVMLDARVRPRRPRHVVDQAELVDVDGHLRVEDLAQRGDDFLQSSFGGHHFFRAVERRFQRVPGQRGALDARRVIAHAAEHHQLAEFASPANRWSAGRGTLQQLEASSRFCPSGSRSSAMPTRWRWRSPRPRSWRLDDVAIHLHVELQLVAAERIVAFGLRVASPWHGSCADACCGRGWFPGTDRQTIRRKSPSLSDAGHQRVDLRLVL